MKPKDTTEEVVKKLVKDKSCVECNYEASSRIDFGVHKVPLHCENVLCMSNLVTCEECCANKGSGLEIHENECDESRYKANVRKDVDVHKEHLHLVCYDRSDQSENVHCQGIECNVCSYEVDGKDDLRVHGEFDHEGLASINYRKLLIRNHLTKVISTKKSRFNLFLTMNCSRLLIMVTVLVVAKYYRLQVH